MEKTYLIRSQHLTSTTGAADFVTMFGKKFLIIHYLFRALEHSIRNRLAHFNVFHQVILSYTQNVLS